MLTEAIKAVYEPPIDIARVTQASISLFEESSVVEITTFEIDQWTEYLSRRREPYLG